MVLAKVRADIRDGLDIGVGSVVLVRVDISQAQVAAAEMGSHGINRIGIGVGSVVLVRVDISQVQVAAAEMGPHGINRIGIGVRGMMGSGGGCMIVLWALFPWRALNHSVKLVGIGR